MRIVEFIEKYASRRVRTTRSDWVPAPEVLLDMALARTAMPVPGMRIY